MTISVMEKPQTTVTWSVEDPLTLTKLPVTKVSGSWYATDASNYYNAVTPNAYWVTTNYAPAKREVTHSLGARMVKILMGAAEAITTQGWIQGSYWMPGMGFCLYGALQYAMTGAYPMNQYAAIGAVGDHAAFTAASQVLSMIIRNTSSMGGDIPSWNDHPGRTKAEVHKLLADAIKFTQDNYQ